MNTLKIFIPILFFLISVNTDNAFSQTTAEKEVGVDEHLGLQVPLDAKLIDETGKTVTLRELINNKPAVINLVYYRCPGICSPLMTGLAEVMDKVDLISGQDYTVITVSFDPTEDYIMAAEKKKNYLSTFKNKIINENGWRFLTADSNTIKSITNAVGFRYIKVDNDYIHSGVITMLSPEGKIMRYLYGLDFLPFDFKMALVEASEGKTGSTIAKIVKLCYSYDPEGKKYALNLTRVIGAAMITGIAIFAIALFVTKKRKTKV